MSQVDEEGRELIRMKETSDHKIDKSVIRKREKGIIRTKVQKLLVGGELNKTVPS